MYAYGEMMQKSTNTFIILSMHNIRGMCSLLGAIVPQVR